VQCITHGSWKHAALLTHVLGPCAGYLFYKSVDEANKLSERMDKMDGNR